MGWLVRERRGVGWKDEALKSISAPPLPLLVFLGLFMMLMYFATYTEFKESVERSKMGFRFGLLLLPLMGVLMLNLVMLYRRWWYCTLPVAEEEGSWPWGLLVVVGLLLVMVHYQSSFKTAWFRSY